MKESDIQKQIFNYCTKIAEHKNIMFFSIPNESLMTALRMFKVDSKTSAMLVNHFKSMGLVAGIPDTCLLFSGKTYFFELKRENAEAGIIQKIVHTKIRKTGHEVFIVKSLDEFILKLIEIGVV